MNIENKGLADLRLVVEVLRQFGRFNDEEGEVTNNLQDLIDSLATPPAVMPAAPSDAVREALESMLFDFGAFDTDEERLTEFRRLRKLARTTLSQTMQPQAAPGDGPGSPAFRFLWLMEELQKRFPDPAPFSAIGYEDRLLPMLDAMLAAPPSTKDREYPPLPAPELYQNFFDEGIAYSSEPDGHTREAYYTADQMRAYVDADRKERQLSACNFCLAQAAEARAALRAPAESGWQPTDAARDVLAERQRQISAEGWTLEHDDSHVTQFGEPEMAIAAACYAMAGVLRDSDIVDTWWPWDEASWKPTKPRRNLIKAGALILAEIERLDRAMLKAAPSAAQPGESEGEVK